MEDDETMGMKETQCLELEESVSKDLETKMQNRDKEFECRFKELESEKLVVEDSLTELMMVNKALEVEKQEAENRAEEWKRKFEKLAETVRKLDEIDALVELDEDVKVGLELAAPVGMRKMESLSREGLANHQVSPYVTTPVKDSMSGRNRDGVSCRRRVNKMLVFEDDSETEERSIGEEEYEDEDVGANELNINTPRSGRKRRLVITSDSEDDEDNIPIATLKNLKPKNHEVSDLVDDTPITGENVSGGFRRLRRVSSRLRKQRALEEITGNDEDDETEEEWESESLNGFIVPDEHASEEESDGETCYADVMSRLRRDKKPGEQNWELEPDMLADFGKDDELCMRAVCVLYRFQTEAEKATRSTHVANGRGFNTFDADRGSRLGQFLTDGDPDGDLKKSVEELRSFRFDAVEICRDLAIRYSGQLFQIYNNREVPFFAAPPSSP